jgi:hypothetical protein
LPKLSPGDLRALLVAEKADGLAHNNMPPTMMVNYIMRVL